jgi:serine/threonine protein phosphatase PrpC
MASTYETNSESESKALGSFSFYSEIGARDQQQDRLVAETLHLGDKSMQILAVMDGHGGAGVAQLVAERLVPTIQSSYQPGENISQLLKATVFKLNEATKKSSSGSTLSIVAIPDDEPGAYAAVLGDSPVIVFGGSGEANVGPQHNVRSNLEERLQAEERGAIYDKRGFIRAKNGRLLLQMSRALGDRDLDEVLSRTPDIYPVELSEDSVIVVATDGVLDPSHKNNPGALYYLANMITADKADAETVVREAVKGNRADNATAIVWRMKAK